jgi:MFS transporter, ACS family, solute carrier family 17 (sodium-dependent inorganic phosphate cotransporter), member 5
MHHLTGKWIPPNERSKFVSAYLGSSIGVAIAYPLFGFVIKASSWEWAFHLCGIAGVIWYMFWLYFVSFVTQSLAVLMIKSSQGL